eukprot:SAG31_NODE_3175_length_4586_cov_4.176064_7_plen_81_part_00
MGDHFRLCGGVLRSFSAPFTMRFGVASQPSVQARRRRIYRAQPLFAIRTRTQNGRLPIGRTLQSNAKFYTIFLELLVALG